MYGVKRCPHGHLIVRASFQEATSLCFLSSAPLFEKERNTRLLTLNP